MGGFGLDLGRGVTAAFFPGQGAQSLGMGLALAERYSEARRTLEEADRLIPGLLAKITSGPEEELAATETLQPALLAVSVASYRAYRQAGGAAPDYAAGHSLGEWSAHVAAGSLELAQALQLVQRRGRYMQEAVPIGQSGMAAVLKLNRDQVAEIISEIPELWIANFNSPEQVVLSGTTAALAVARPQIEAARGRWAALKVSAAFHSPLMAPAQARLAPEVAQTQFQAPEFPVYANVSAQPETDPARIRQLLTEQITQPVRWEDIVRDLTSKGVKAFLEFGPGNTLTGLAKRIEREISAWTVANPGDLEAALEGRHA